MRPEVSATPSAPITAPIPMDDVSAPYPAAPRCSTSRAKTGIIAMYGKPNTLRMAVSSISVRTRRSLRRYVSTSRKPVHVDVVRAGRGLGGSRINSNPVITPT